MNPKDFIKEYVLALKSQDWKTVDPLIHDKACVTFSNGAVHYGKAEVKSAFKHNFELIKSEKYSVENVRWILINESMAAYTYDYVWQGYVNDKLINGDGIGTTVLIKEDEHWLLLTENLSKKAV